MNKIIFIIFIFCFTAVKAQYKKPFFHTLSVMSGLPEANILSSLQDKKGYMWFGTQNGLVRYDGYQLKPYLLLNDEGLVVSPSTVNYLYEDNKGKLWAFCYQQGIYFYDGLKDAFLKLPLDKEFMEKLKKANNFRKWIEDKQQPHMNWFFTVNSVEDKNHIYLFDDSRNTFEDFSVISKDRHFIPMDKGADIAQDANGKIWIIADTLLSYFDWKTKSFQPFFVLPPDPAKKYYFSVITPDPADADILWLNTYIPNEREYTRKFLRLNTKTKAYEIVTAASISPGKIAPYSYLVIFTDSLKRVWLATEKAIAMYNGQNGQFTNFALNIPPTNNDRPFVNCITSDAAGNLWIGGNFKGLVYLNVANSATNFSGVTNDEGSLPDNFIINKLFFDRTGTLWVNMPFSGIAYLDRQKSLFTPVPVIPPGIKADKKITSEPYSIRGIDGDNIFFISDDVHLFAWNYQQNNFNKIALEEKKLHGDIGIVVKDKDGSIWMLGRELVNYNPLTKKIKNYHPKDSSSRRHDYMTALTIGKEGKLWIGTAQNGLYSFNKQSETFTHYPFIKNDLTITPVNALDDNSVHSLLFDADGILWIGTDKGGLNRFDTKTEKFTSFLNYKNGLFGVMSLYEDSHKRLWAGTYQSGLFLVDKKTGTFNRYTEKDGLIHNGIFSITDDIEGNTWVKTQRGISRFNPTTKIFTNYPIEIGTDAYQLIGFFRETNGLLHVTTKNGLISFDPAKMHKSTTSPAVIIESVRYAAGSNRDTILNVDERNNLQLKYNQNRVGFKFVALHYANAMSNQYAYKLNGYDKDWTNATNPRPVNYSNLSPGTYTFHVKASNSDGLWNEAGASFTFTISPPWWFTWWAYCVYALLIGGSIWAFTQYRSRVLRKENLVLEAKVNDRTKQLQQSIETIKSTQAQLIQSEKMASLGELTAGIAHEIKNPLNFVTNFSEVSKELLDEMKTELDNGNTANAKEIADDLIHNLEKINHHGKRADAIVKGMLQHSRVSNAVKEPTDINKLADEYLRLSYHGLRAKDKLFNAALQTNFDESIGLIKIIPQDIGRVILNLFNNAFYAVNEKKQKNTEGYEPIVSVSTKKTGDKLEIKVADNGNGIPQKIVDKIFQPFFTTKPTGQGTGLGLSLSYDIIKAHGGEIKVETKEGEGSEFIIQLPIV